MNKYSQNNEQEWVQNWFGDYIGSFCDIGANDGITFSNTYLLALQGWGGVLIEPSHEAFKRLLVTYDGNMDVVLFNCAATGSFEGNIKMYESGEHIGKGDVSLLSTLHKDELRRWTNTANFFTETMVEARPVNHLLKEAGFETIDFFSVDVEGSEIDIISQVDFQKYSTKLICVEWNGKQGEVFDSILNPQGFQLINQNLENRLYAKH